MRCLVCQSDNLSVIDSREVASAIRRRRLCLACKHRFTTYERLESPNITVIKKDNRREKFCQDKLIRGISQACKNRPIDPMAIEVVADQIERDIYILGEEEVTSHYIGEKVLEALIKLDPVGYLRFASVHKSFTDLKSFEREIQKFKSKI